MKISVVTISYNQAQFLEACLDSVASQEGPWEHIIVDPGSTDGSRDIIEARRHQFSHVILEPDNGPADGLNKGFAKASGDVFYYLNSDDIVMPNAFSEVRRAFGKAPELDVISGSGAIIDENGSEQRKVYSNPITRHRLAYGGGILIQPATFIRRDAFTQAGGFNSDNRSSWDSELVVDMFLNGARFGLQNDCLGGYRLHGESITATGKMDEKIEAWSRRRFQKLMSRPLPSFSWVFRYYYSLERAVRHPDVISARLKGNRVYGSMRPKK